MAFSTHPHYPFTPSKPHHPTPHHPTPHTHFHKHPPKPHKSSSIYSSSSSSSSSAPSPNPNVAAAASTSSSSSSSSSPSPCPSPQNPILDPNSPIAALSPYYSRRFGRSPNGLSLDFRRTRTTGVVSKQNLASPKAARDHHSRAAAVSCLAQILQSGADASAMPAALRGALAAPDDYCFLLHELGDRDKHPPKALAVFHSSMPLMRGPVEQGKLARLVIIPPLGALGSPCLRRSEA